MESKPRASDKPGSIQASVVAAQGFLAMDTDTRARLCLMFDFDHTPTANPADQTFDALLMGYTTLRHTQAIEKGEEASAGTLGVGVLHHSREGRRHSFVLLEDTSLSLPKDTRRSLESRFGVFDGKEIVDANSPSAHDV